MREFSTLDRIQHRFSKLFDQLPPLPALVRLRREVARQAVQYASHKDTVQLEKLMREVESLARALGVESGGRINHGLAAQELVPTESIVQRATGPGLPGWGRRTRSRPSSWRRPHAPLQYPWGDAPPVSPPRRSEVLPSIPEALLPKDCQERLRAMRAYWAERNAEEDDAWGRE